MGTIRLGKIVYYDSVSTNLCNKTTFDLDAINNGTSTCYKWRVISTDTTWNNINIQLDHNLVNTSAWNMSGNTTDGPVTILSSLVTATSTWTRVPGLTYSYDTSASSQNQN